MSACSTKSGLLSAGLLLVALLSPAGAEPPDLPCKAGACRPAVGKMVTRIYPVADLVIPIDDSPATICVGDGQASVVPNATKPGPKTQEEKLIRLLTGTVVPKSWIEQGGPGTIDYSPLTMALVINQTAVVHERVADLLAALRRQQDVQVALEVRIVTVPENLCQRIGVDFSQGKAEVMRTPANLPALLQHLNIPFTSGSAKLTDRQAAALLEAIQGDPQASVMQAPKVTAFNGQRIAVEITDRKLLFSGMEVERRPNGAVISRPKTEPISTGLRFALQPVVSPDRRGVEMDVTFSTTDLDAVSDAAQAPRPVRKCCAAKEPTAAPERQARLTTHTLRRLARLPDGGTLLLDNGTKWCVCSTETRVPVLGELPYVNRLFRTIGYQRTMMHQLILVTPRILINNEEEERRPAVSVCPFVRAKQEKAQAPSAPVPEHLATPLENLAKLEKAEAIYQQAQKMRRAGRSEQAARAYEEVRRLCPGSRLDLRASRDLEDLHREQVAKSSEEQEVVPAMPPRETKLTKLLHCYREACAEGRLDDARKLATRALAIDPACFSKIGK